MNIPKLEDMDVNGKRIVVRADLDFDPSDTTNLRLTSLTQTLDCIKEKGGQIILIGHRGRPEGKVVESLSLMPFKPLFERWNPQLEENLRFDPGEESNDIEFAKRLSTLGDVYVNEAFGVSHRNHASVVALPSLLPHAAGFRFLQEIEKLNKVVVGPKRPVISIISGLKEDKLSYINDFLKFSERILIGGRLPDLIEDESPLRRDSRIIVASLIPDKEDITIHSMESFELEIKSAGTIVLSGPIGKFEDEGHRQGTSRILSSIVESDAFKIAGGGDTERAISIFNLGDKFDWISTGGGAMLEFLAKGSLPGLAALLE